MQSTCAVFSLNGMCFCCIWFTIPFLRLVTLVSPNIEAWRMMLVYTVANIWQFEHKNSKWSSRVALGNKRPCMLELQDWNNVIKVSKNRAMYVVYCNSNAKINWLSFCLIFVLQTCIVCAFRKLIFSLSNHNSSLCHLMNINVHPYLWWYIEDSSMLTVAVHWNIT